MRDRNGVEIKPGDILKWMVTHYEHVVELDENGLYIMQGAPAQIPRVPLSALELDRHEIIGHADWYDDFLKKRPGQ